MPTDKGKVQVRRAYEEPAASDGTRVLVDRIWPRGLTKAKAARAEALAHLRALAKDHTLTPLTATRRPEISEAQVLARLLAK